MLSVFRSLLRHGVPSSRLSKELRPPRPGHTLPQRPQDTRGAEIQTSLSRLCTEDALVEDEDRDPALDCLQTLSAPPADKTLMAGALDKLPHEVLSLCVARLGLADLNSVRRVCCSLRAVADHYLASFNRHVEVTLDCRWKTLHTTLLPQTWRMRRWGVRPCPLVLSTVDESRESARLARIIDKLHRHTRKLIETNQTTPPRRVGHARSTWRSRLIKALSPPAHLQQEPLEFSIELPWDACPLDDASAQDSGTQRRADSLACMLAEWTHGLEPPLPSVSRKAMRGTDGDDRNTPTDAAMRSFLEEACHPRYAPTCTCVRLRIPSDQRSLGSLDVEHKALILTMRASIKDSAHTRGCP